MGVPNGQCILRPAMFLVFVLTSALAIQIGSTFEVMGEISARSVQSWGTSYTTSTRIHVDAYSAVNSRQLNQTSAICQVIGGALNYNDVIR